AAGIDRIAAGAPGYVLLARGGGAVAAAIVQGDAGVSGEAVIRFRVSRRFDRNGLRLWEDVHSFTLDLVAPPTLHVLSTGQPFLLVASRRLTDVVLRAIWIDALGQFQEESISGAAAQFQVDAVLTSVR